jgi:uncharacterized membrane protein
MMGLLFLGLVLKTILGVVLVSAVFIFLWKLGKLADVYADKLRNSSPKQ